MQYQKMISAILDVAEAMLECGAEVARVEDSMYRMCSAYGFSKISVSVLSANIFLTVKDPTGDTVSQMRRTHSVRINFDRLDYLNNLSRQVCENKPSLEEFEQMFTLANERPNPPVWFEYLGAAIIGASFAVFFGGTYYDGLASSVLCLAIFFMQRFLSKIESNPLAEVFIASVISGFIALGMVGLGFGDNSDKIIIGGIMLLIPGVHMTNSIRDMLTGDIISGFFRLMNAVLLAAAIACGFAIPIILTGGGAI